MTITEAVALTYLRATGKTTVLTSGNKYNRIIGLLDNYQQEWADEPGVDWASLYDPAFSLGTITATDSFDLDTSSIRKLSDREGDNVRIVWTDGTSYTDYAIIPPTKLKDYSFGVDKDSPLGNYCARIGGQLVFNHEFVSTDNEYGGELFVPVYTYPDTITSDNPDDDEVAVDNPRWLTTIAAAEYCRNDLTRRQRFPELQGEANIMMARMKDDQEGQITEVDRPWTPPSGIGSDNAWS